MEKIMIQKSEIYSNLKKIARDFVERCLEAGMDYTTTQFLFLKHPEVSEYRHNLCEMEIANIFRMEYYDIVNGRLYEQQLRVLKEKVLPEYRDFAFNLGINGSLYLSLYFTGLLWDLNLLCANEKKLKHSHFPKVKFGHEELNPITGLTDSVSNAKLLREFLEVCGEESNLMAIKSPLIASSTLYRAPAESCVRAMTYGILTKGLKTANVITKDGNHYIYNLDSGGQTANIKSEYEAKIIWQGQHIGLLPSTYGFFLPKVPTEPVISAVDLYNGREYIESLLIDNRIPLWKVHQVVNPYLNSIDESITSNSRSKQYFKEY